MGVRPGYKQTEVGMIPTDWHTRPCSAISDLITVGIVVRPTQYYAKQGVPALRSANIREDGIDDQDMVFISEKANALLSKSQVRTGDVLTVRTGYPGTSAVVPPSFAGSNCIDILITRPSKAVSSQYLSAWINSSLGKYQVLRNQGGLAQQHFNVGDLRNLVVALPPTKAEQEAIAEALSDVDALIDSLEQLLAKKRQVKQGAMQELLTGKTRLPGFNGEWKVRRLGEVASTDPEYLRGDTHPNFTFNYIALEDVDVGTLSSHSEQVFRAAPSRARRKLRRDDVLISTVRPNLMSHLLFAAEGDAWVCSTGFCVVRCNEGISHPGYVYFHMFAGCVARQIEALLTGSNYPAINGGDVRALQIPFPEYEEQAAIAAILRDMDAEISTIKAKLAKARGIKQGMMQELLTGRIRLI